MLAKGIYSICYLHRLRVIFLAALRKQYQEKNRRNENIHPDGVQVAGPAAEDIFMRQEPRLTDQVFDRAEKFPVEMGDVVEKMLDQVPHRFLRFQVLLAADMTEATGQFGPAIQANLFFSFF